MMNKNARVLPRLEPCRGMDSGSGSDLARNRDHRVEAIGSRDVPVQIDRVGFELVVPGLHLNQRSPRLFRTVSDPDHAARAHFAALVVKDALGVCLDGCIGGSRGAKGVEQHLGKGRTAEITARSADAARVSASFAVSIPETGMSRARCQSAIGAPQSLPVAVSRSQRTRA